MSILQTLRDFVELSTQSFDNASGTMERVHQKSADMSIDLLKELGFPGQVADDYRQFHHRIVDALATALR